MNWKCRYAPSLGALEDTPENVWGTEVISPFLQVDDPVVFFGLYGLPDFYQLWRHKGRKAILWAGTDIIHFKKGYWLDDQGEIKLWPGSLAEWINKNCENYVENEVEREALLEVGIGSIVIPSFLGKVENYPITFYPSRKPKLYTSVSGNNFEQYGWFKIKALAEQNPKVEFHLYGNTAEFPDWGLPNVFVRGRVPKEEMNKEIKRMHGALRLTEFDGFSEIIAKSLLWGQWPVSLIEYPHTLRPENINILFRAERPNYKGRDWLLSVVNKYPWNMK